jgi:DNA-binding MarR family transcriptional regulator
MNVGHLLAMSLRSAYWTLHRRTDSAVAPLGVTANQYVLLCLLAEHSGLTQRALVELASSDPNTVRAMLLVLQRNGFIDRTPHPEDGRAWQISLTSKGRKALQRIKASTDSLRSSLLAALRPNESTQLLEMLQRITAALNSHPPNTRTTRVKRRRTERSGRSIR